VKSEKGRLAEGCLKWMTRFKQERFSINTNDMAEDRVSSAVIRLLRNAHRGGRPCWPNFDTVTSGAQYRVLHRLCREWLPHEARVLDWGAGTGHASVYLSRAGFSVTGYSLEEFFYRDFIGEQPYRFVAADPNEPVLLPFENGEFDAVVSVGVLEHVRETGGQELGSLQEIYRILRPRGVMLCVHLPNALSWIEAVARRRGRGHVHAYRYRRAEVLRLFGEANFHIERYGRYGALPRNKVGHILPRWLCDSEFFSRLYDMLDRTGSGFLPWFAQNHFIVARRPAQESQPVE